MLNRIWPALFFLAFAACVYQALLGNTEVFEKTIAASFTAAKSSVEISIGLIGLLCFWLGLFQIAEKSGLTDSLARLLTPLFSRLMPEVPAGHPALGSVTLNMAANMLGLDNAATPMGLKAMKDLQTLNPHADTATNAQILFLVINSSSVTLIPVSIFMYRAQFYAENPASVFLPILLATSASTLAGLLSVAWLQKLKLWDKVMLAYAAGFALLMAMLLSMLVTLPPDVLSARSALLGNLVLFGIIVLFLLAGWRKNIALYDEFIVGAKQGFDLAIGLIPFLVAMLVAIAMVRASGLLDFLLTGLAQFIAWLGVNTDFVPALSTALIKPFSGSGARAMMIETMQHYGVDSFPALVAATIQGSSETTFYVLAVYFGAVGIRKERHALACALFADLVGAAVAIWAAYRFFHV
ncbi:MAG TPA: nucleoside recognition domain-containing protein [Pseudomonadales bacterium]|nr:nucleoside recognition domain-containing protein [Pseudomonadales bacterium]